MCLEVEALGDNSLDEVMGEELSWGLVPYKVIKGPEHSFSAM